MTRKQQINMMKRLARKYRRLAGELKFVDYPRMVDCNQFVGTGSAVAANINLAHDHLCRAFQLLEDGAR